MGYGDEILAAGQAERARAETGNAAVIVDQRGRARWHDIWEGNPAILNPHDLVQSEFIDSPLPGIRRILNAPGARPYIVYPFTEETGWTFDRSFKARDNIARIYLTPAEREFGENIRRSMDDGRPLVLFDPWSKHPNLRWPIEHWTELIRLNPDVLWVQQFYPLGYAHGIPGAFLCPTESFRWACGLLASASVYLRGESGMCHAAAALGIPNVTIWGGCMDWEVLGGYPKQIGVGVQQTGGQPPCGRYRACSHCQTVMASISPFEVGLALRRALAGDFSLTPAPLDNSVVT